MNTEEVVRKALEEVSQKLMAALPKSQRGEENGIPDRFMSSAETCTYLGNISRVNLWNLRSKLGLKTHRVGGKLLFKKSELDAFVAAGDAKEGEDHEKI